jgi:hypothetical protein
MVPPVTALVVSCQLVLGTFFLSILGIKETRHTSIRAEATIKVSDEHATAQDLGRVALGCDPRATDL